MCGIAGVFDPRTRRDGDELGALVGTMIEPLRPRGPDGEGIWVDASVGLAFGHRRLAVLDLSDEGAQPMVSADGRWVITYNGEIYNHADHADELRARGHRFRGHSDTEVLVESIAAWGLEETLERIDGMYAFGLWDRRDRRLHLVRDRFGEKPLCWSALPSGEIVFASTLAGLRAHPDLVERIDRDALTLYFRHKYVPAPHTILQGVHKVEPGCVVSFDETGHRSDQRYWDYPSLVAGSAPFAGSPQDAVEELSHRLDTAVRRCLVADVPVGAFLSGGVDSTAVVAAGARCGTVRTFTIGSTDAGFDESADAEAVAARLGTDHTTFMVGPAEALAVVPELGAIYDEPFADSSQIPSRLVAALARQHVTVAVTGDGGDELFGGYNRYTWVPAVWSRCQRLPVVLRRAAARVLHLAPPGPIDRAASRWAPRGAPRQPGTKLAKLADVLDAAGPEEMYRRLVTHWPDPELLVRGGHEPPTWHSEPRQVPEVGGIVRHMMTVDTVTYLPDDILTKVDRAAMSVSLETRVPLLSRSVAELAASLPVGMLLSEGVSKWPLRQLARRAVGDPVDRPKAGFGVPLGEWLRGPLRDWAGDLLAKPQLEEYVDLRPVRAAWDRHQAGRGGEEYRLWDVVMLSDWMGR
jgi:asparagine synthase (glutamine-hydrolysing)